MFCLLDCCATLQELPAELGRLPALAQLDARNNQIADLPPALGDAAALNELRVGFNNLSSLPSTLGSLRSLRTLDCRNNLITVSDCKPMQWADKPLEPACAGARTTRPQLTPQRQVEVQHPGVMGDP
jgi:Leucine-rich repeat (LRR) protein